MDLQKLLKTLEERHEAYHKIWARLSRRDKFIIIGLVVVGVINIMVGSIMIWSRG